MNETKIKSGEDFHFGNDISEGLISWSNRLNKFGVFLNDNLIYTSETFKPSKNKAEEIINKYNFVA